METFAIFVGGAIISFVIEHLKKRFEFSARIALMVLAIIIGAGYTGFTLLVPEATQASIITYITGTLGSAWVVYEIFIKTIDGDAPSLKFSAKDAEEKKD